MMLQVMICTSCRTAQLISVSGPYDSYVNMACVCGSMSTFKRLETWVTEQMLNSTGIELAVLREQVLELSRSLDAARSRIVELEDHQALDNDDIENTQNDLDQLRLEFAELSDRL